MCQIVNTNTQVEAIINKLSQVEEGLTEVEKLVYIDYHFKLNPYYSKIALIQAKTVLFQHDAEMLEHQKKLLEAEKD